MMTAVHGFRLNVKRGSSDTMRRVYFKVDTYKLDFLVV